MATPPGRGGIGVVRLAGPEARSIVEPLLRLKHPLEAGRAVFGEVVDSEEVNAGRGAQRGRQQCPRHTIPNQALASMKSS